MFCRSVRLTVFVFLPVLFTSHCWSQDQSKASQDKSKASITIPITNLTKSLPSDAQFAKEGVVYEKKTVINFEDETIQGDLTRPDGEYIESAGKVNHSNLIRIREEFHEKVMQSVDEL